MALSPNSVVPSNLPETTAQSCINSESNPLTASIPPSKKTCSSLFFSTSSSAAPAAPLTGIPALGRLKDSTTSIYQQSRTRRGRSWGVYDPLHGPWMGIEHHTTPSSNVTFGILLVLKVERNLSCNPNIMPFPAYLVKISRKRHDVGIV